MKTCVSIFALAFALTLATNQARAQVAWSSIASGCVLQTSGQGLASVSAVFGTVSFKPSSSGNIKLTCPVRATHQITPSAVNDFVITFYDDHGFDGGVNHCYITADLLRSNLNNVEGGGDLGTIAAANKSFTGRQTLDVATSEILDFNTSYYWVDIQLHRDASTATCNPTLVGTFLQNLIH
jgi:hypothetical protein